MTDEDIKKLETNRLFDIERYFFPTKVKYLSNQLSQLY